MMSSIKVFFCKVPLFYLLREFDSVTAVPTYCSKTCKCGISSLLSLILNFYAAHASMHGV